MTPIEATIEKTMKNLKKKSKKSVKFCAKKNSSDIQKKAEGTVDRSSACLEFFSDFQLKMYRLHIDKNHSKRHLAKLFFLS